MRSGATPVIIVEVQGSYLPVVSGFWRHGMSFSASSAHSNTDERVLDVQFTEDTISVSLRDGRIITVPLVWYPRLLDATAAQRKNWEIAGGGYGIHWPDVDEDLSTEGLLRGAPAPRASVTGAKPVSKRHVSKRQDR